MPYFDSSSGIKPLVNFSMAVGERESARAIVVARRIVCDDRGGSAVPHIDGKPAVVDAVFVLVDEDKCHCRPRGNEVTKLLHYSVFNLTGPSPILNVPHPAVHREAACAGMRATRRIH